MCLLIWDLDKTKKNKIPRNFTDSLQSKTSNSFNLECKDSAGCEEMALTKELCSAIPDLKSTCPIKCGIKTCDNNQGKEDFWKK